MAVLGQCAAHEMRVFRGSCNTYLYTSTPNYLLEANVSKIFHKLGVYVKGKDIYTCHRLKDKNRAFVKFGNRKNSLQILCVKKNSKSLDPIELDFLESTIIFINKSLCAYYHGLWNKFKKLKGIGKLNVFFVSSGAIKVTMLVNDPVKPITHAFDLKMFPDIDIDNL